MDDMVPAAISSRLSRGAIVLSAMPTTTCSSPSMVNSSSKGGATIRLSGNQRSLKGTIFPPGPASTPAPDSPQVPGLKWGRIPSNSTFSSVKSKATLPSPSCSLSAKEKPMRRPPGASPNAHSFSLVSLTLLNVWLWKIFRDSLMRNCSADFRWMKRAFGGCSLKVEQRQWSCELLPQIPRSIVSSALSMSFGAESKRF